MKAVVRSWTLATRPRCSKRWPTWNAGAASSAAFSASFDLFGAGWGIGLRTAQYGVPDEAAWSAAEWTGPFVDIEGEGKPLPRHETRARMAWDDDYFYVAAEMVEPHLWGTLTERDAVIYHDNDFEVFIDPDGDNHRYYELEINALGTEWDLFLVRPHRDGGPALNADHRGEMPVEAGYAGAAATGSGRSAASPADQDA